MWWVFEVVPIGVTAIAIGVAQALRLPAINLTGLLGVATSEVSNIQSDGGVWSIGGSLLGPIYDFGKNQRRVEIEEGVLARRCGLIVDIGEKKFQTRIPGVEIADRENLTGVFPQHAALIERLTRS